MGFEYCCFISYSHNQGELPDRFINDLYKTLSGEIGALTSEINTCCVDWDRLRGGDFYNEIISKSICRSVCMIMVYTPTYFDRNHMYCAREFKAMEKIESKRLRLIGELSGNHGLIIPIVYRGENYIYPYIKSKRQYYNFSGYFPGRNGENSLLSHPTYGPQLKEIAEYIYERYLLLKDLWNVSLRCRNFKLPSEKEAQKLLKRVCVADAKMPFPGRRR
jgi:hypothetical protein